MGEELPGRKYLVTTPIKDTWPVQGKIIFLGEWCKLYSKKSEWENLDYETLPYHWDNRSKFNKDFEYICKLKSKLLVELVEILNTIHKVNYKTTDWDKFIGWWLFYFLGVIYDRWESIRLAEASFDNVKTIFLKFNKTDFTAKNSVDFIDKSISDDWNSYIFYEIINYRGVINTEQKNKLLKTKSFQLRKNSLKIKLFRLYQKLISFLKLKNTPLILNAYISLIDDFKLNFKFNTLPFYTNFEDDFNIDKSSLSTSRDKLRDWRLGCEENDFELFIGKLISSQFPINFIEGFVALNNKLNKNFWPSNPKFILTANLFYENDLFNLYVLKKSKEGSKFYSVQHGGNYGIGKLSALEIHQIMISDIFFTWGWSNNKISNKFYPQGIFTKTKWKGHSFNSKKILVLALEEARYSRQLYFGHISSSWLNHFNDQLRFINNLNKLQREQLVIKLQNPDFGWNQKKRWIDFDPLLEIYSGNIKKLIPYTKVIVCTYNSTAFLESIYHNIPTIIFWDPKYWELSEEATGLFELLKEARIFHETPESAAIHLNTIYESVKYWWTSKKVQDALKALRNKYARDNNDFSRVLKRL